MADLGRIVLPLLVVFVAEERPQRQESRRHLLLL